MQWKVTLISNGCQKDGELVQPPCCISLPLPRLLSTTRRPGGFSGSLPSALPGSLLPRGMARGLPILASLHLTSSSPCQVFCSSWVLIEMANSGDGAYSQLCQPPLPGAGGRKQNPSNVASEPLSIQQERSLLPGPVGLSHGGGSPGWLKAQVPAFSQLPAKKHLTSLHRPHCRCAKRRGQFSAKWRPGGS